MLPDQKVRIVRKNCKFLKQLEDKGYNVAHTEFDICISDLPKYSRKFVEVICDYCGESFEMQYMTYTNSKKNKYNSKDACKEHRILKRKESSMLKHGVEFTSQLEEVKEKKRRTVYDRYGVDNVSQLEEVKNKKKKTSMEKYGGRILFSNR